MTEVPPARPEDVELAKELAAGAAIIAMSWYRSTDLMVESKDDESPVTQADKGIEDFLRTTVLRQCPDDTVVGEEDGVTAGTGERRWYFDPIDGTTGFTRGVPLFSTLIALFDEHGPAVGVIALPALQETVIAGRGHGCTFNAAPCSVSEQPTLRGSVVTTWGYEEWPLELLQAMQTNGVTLKGWGDGYGYALVATGRADAYIDTSPKEWDIGPMPVIMSEAGGRFSAFDGTETIDRGTGLASNGWLHNELLQTVTSAVPPRA